jgi:uncharacterized damage-inducible protein DinB
MTQQPEAWLRGPIVDCDPILLPVGHSLVQAREDLEQLATRVEAADVWTRPGGAASIGFHVMHLGGALDRLFTYARGEMLDDRQKAAAKAEAEPSSEQTLAGVTAETLKTIQSALDQLARTPRETVLDGRKVGRAGLPATVLGLLFHAAEHTTRHVGQAVTTAKILQDGRT